MEPTYQPNSNIQINESAKTHLRSMASWAIIIVIIAVIGYVISIIKFVSQQNQLAGYPYNSNVKSAGIVGLIFTIIIGLLINYFLFQFASLTKKGVNNLSQNDLDRGFGNLKTYFAFIGVLVIIAIVLGAIMVAYLSSHPEFFNTRYNY